MVKLQRILTKKAIVRRSPGVTVVVCQPKLRRTYD